MNKREQHDLHDKVLRMSSGWPHVMISLGILLLQIFLLSFAKLLLKLLKLIRFQCPDFWIQAFLNILQAC